MHECSSRDDLRRRSYKRNSIFYNDLKKSLPAEIWRPAQQVLHAPSVNAECVHTSQGREESFFLLSACECMYILLLAGLKSQLHCAAQQVLWATDRKTNKVSITQCVLLTERLSWSTRKILGASWVRQSLGVARKPNPTDWRGRECSLYHKKALPVRAGEKTKTFFFPNGSFAPKRATGEIWPTSHFGQIRYESLEKKHSRDLWHLHNYKGVWKAPFNESCI